MYIIFFKSKSPTTLTKLNVISLTHNNNVLWLGHNILFNYEIDFTFQKEMIVWKYNGVFMKQFDYDNENEQNDTRPYGLIHGNFAEIQSNIILR